MVAVLSALACTGTPYRMPLPEYDRTKCRELGYSEGNANGRMLLYFPLHMNNLIESATKQAIEKNGGDSITDVITVERYGGLGTSHAIRVRGVVPKCKGPLPESDYDRGIREEQERIEGERAPDGGR